MSKIHFPGLAPLRLAIWTCYFRGFLIFLSISFQFFGDDLWVNFSEHLPILPLKAAILAFKGKLILSGLVGHQSPRPGPGYLGPCFLLRNRYTFKIQETIIEADSSR